MNWPVFFKALLKGAQIAIQVAQAYQGVKGGADKLGVVSQIEAEARRQRIRETVQGQGR